MIYKARQFSRDCRWGRQLNRDGALITDPTIEEIGAFAEHLNSGLSDNHELQEHYGIDSHPVSFTRASQIMTEVAESLALPEDSITFHQTSKVPQGAVLDFARSCSGDFSKAYHNDNKFVALRGHDLAGFVSFKPWRKVLSIHALYTVPDYREQGIGRRLVYQTMAKARRDGLVGVDIDNLSIGGSVVLGSVRKHTENNPWINVRHWGEEMKYYGEIRFTDRAETK